MFLFVTGATAMALSVEETGDTENEGYSAGHIRFGFRVARVVLRQG